MTGSTTSSTIGGDSSEGDHQHGKNVNRGPGKKQSLLGVQSEDLKAQGQSESRVIRVDGKSDLLRTMPMTSLATPCLNGESGQSSYLFYYSRHPRTRMLRCMALQLKALLKSFRYPRPKLDQANSDFLLLMPSLVSCGLLGQNS